MTLSAETPRQSEAVVGSAPSGAMGTTESESAASSIVSEPVGVTGPWKIGFSDGSGADDFTITDADDKVVVRSGDSFGLKYGILNAANARLIAAVPILLGIAQRWAALDAGSWHVDRHAADKRELLDDTRAVIRKATGVTP